MNEPEMYAPDYLRAQKDKQLHLIAEMIEQQSDRMGLLRAENINLHKEIGEAYHKGLNDRAVEIANNNKLLESYRQKNSDQHKRIESLLAVNQTLETKLSQALESEARLAAALGIGAELGDFAPGIGLHNSFQKGTRAQQMQDVAMKVYRAQAYAYEDFRKRHE